MARCHLFRTTPSMRGTAGTRGGGCRPHVLSEVGVVTAGEDQDGELPGDTGPSNAGRRWSAGRDDNGYARPDLPPVIDRLPGNQGRFSDGRR